MSNNKVILFDIGSKGDPECWNPNCWKARLTLNLKGIDYETKWLEYPEIAPTLKEHGFQPHPEGSGEMAPYTCPAIVLPDGTPVMESKHIADALNRKYPDTTPVQTDHPIVARIEEAMKPAFSLLAPIVVSTAYKTLFNPGSQEHWHANLKRVFGSEDPDEILAKFSTEEHWAKVDQALKDFNDAIDDKGPYCAGETFSFADFIVAGRLRGIRVIGTDLAERMERNAPRMRRVCDALAPYLERADH